MGNNSNINKLIKILGIFDDEYRLYNLEKHIQKLIILAAGFEIGKLVRKMPYDAEFNQTEREHASHWEGLYVDRNLKLKTSIFWGKKLSFECRNILSVRNDGECLFDIKCIETTQQELTKTANEVLDKINKILKDE